MKNYKIFNILKNSNEKNSHLWIAEAEFGYSHVCEKIKLLDSGSDILEVGCGSGILLSIFSEEFSQHKFIGLEPFGDGFNQLKEINSAIKSSSVSIINVPYEDYESSTKFDLIYCINVFEHVQDWRHLLNWATKNLKPNGIFIVLCPNYSFPYESHFKIPIILNKRITKILFNNYIKKFEEDNASLGLWNSLNFVKKKEVKIFTDELGSYKKFIMSDDLSIIDYMVDRISYDDEFKKRQFVIGTIATLIQKIGLLNVLKLFPRFLPYMKLYFIKN